MGAGKSSDAKIAQKSFLFRNLEIILLRFEIFCDNFKIIDSPVSAERNS